MLAVTLNSDRCGDVPRERQVETRSLTEQEHASLAAGSGSLVCSDPFQPQVPCKEAPK